MVSTPALIDVSCSNPADAPILKPNEKLEEDSVVNVDEEPSPGGWRNIKKGTDGAVVVKSTETGLCPRTDAHSLMVVWRCSEESEANTSNFFL